MKQKKGKLNRIIECLFFILVGLALFDLVATVFWISTEKATEANPIMDYFLQKSVYLFAMAKLALTFGGILILDKFKDRSNKLIFKVSLFLILVYAALAGWHIIGAFISSS